MSKRRDRPRRDKVVRGHCAGAGNKVIFESERAARARAVEIASEPEEGRTEGHHPERAYSCNMCGGWHLTSDAVKREIENHGEQERANLAALRRVVGGSKKREA